MWSEQHSERVARVHERDEQIRSLVAENMADLRWLLDTNPLGFSSVAFGFEQAAEKRLSGMADFATEVDRDTDRFAELTGMPNPVEWLKRWFAERRAA